MVNVHALEPPFSAGPFEIPSPVMAAQAGVHHLVQRAAYEVERAAQQRDGRAGGDDQPPVSGTAQKVSAGVGRVNHDAPAHPDVQETQE